MSPNVIRVCKVINERVGNSSASAKPHFRYSLSGPLENFSEYGLCTHASIAVTPFDPRSPIALAKSAVPNPFPRNSFYIETHVMKIASGVSLNSFSSDTSKPQGLSILSVTLYPNLT